MSKLAVLFLAAAVLGAATVSRGNAPVPHSTAPVTFSHDIAPIVFSQCASCHRPGLTAPFPLLTYEDVSKRAKVIAYVTGRRYMPPWRAEPASFPYQDMHRLTDHQIELIQTWVAQGMPKGDPKQMPALPKFPDGWQIGVPDLVVEMPKGFPVPADGPDIYRNFAIPLNWKTDGWIRAVEIKPSSRGLMHHVLYFADKGSGTRPAGENESDGGSAMGVRRGMIPLGGFSTGGQSHLLPVGVAQKIPKGADLVLQYHFHPSGKAGTEKTVVGLYLAKEPPRHLLMNMLLPPFFGLFCNVRIPAGVHDYRITDSFVLPVEVTGVSVAAHAHFLGKTTKLTATLPSGQVLTLLSIRDWDFAWQERYHFQEPVTLPKGTRLDSEVVWDNSADNPRNPSRPPAPVSWGENSTDEMGSLSLQLFTPNEADMAKLQSAYRNHTRGQAIPRMLSDAGLRMWVLGKMGWWSGS